MYSELVPWNISYKSFKTLKFLNMHNLPYFLDLLGTLQLHQIDTCKRHPTSHQKLYILIDPELFLTITVIYCFQIDTRHFVIMLN